MADVALLITIPDAQVAFMVGMVNHFYDKGALPLIPNGVDGEGNPVYLTSAELSNAQRKTLLEWAIKDKFIKQWALVYRNEINQSAALATSEAEVEVFNNAL